MTALDVADLVLIASRVLGIGTGAALAELDVAAAHAALADARLAGYEAGGRSVHPGTAATASVGLIDALLRHEPFPNHGQQVAVAAGLQFLSLNGWQADLDPPAAAAMVVRALAAGRLSPDSAAAWLSNRLSPSPSLRPLRMPRAARKHAGSSKTVSVVAAISAGGLTLLATACSQESHAHAARPAVHHSVEKNYSAGKLRLEW